MIFPVVRIKAAQRLSSAAASAPQQRCQKANDLARAAVCCNDLFGGLAAVVPGCHHQADHPGTEPRGTTGVRRNHTTMQSRRHNGRSVGTTRRTESRAARRDVRWNHPQHTLMLRTTGGQHDAPLNHASTTGAPHHGRSYHTCTTCFLHHERSYHASITRMQHDGNRRHGRSRIAPDGYEKGVPTTFPSRRTACASAAGWESSITRSVEPLCCPRCQNRPDPAGRLHARVGPLPGCGLPLLSPASDLRNEGRLMLVLSALLACQHRASVACYPHMAFETKWVCHRIENRFLSRSASSRVASTPPNPKIRCLHDIVCHPDVSPQGRANSTRSSSSAVPLQSGSQEYLL